jgi:hypothetical protein
MLELMYASGLRVSELVTLKTFHVGMNEGVLRVHGKGSKERLVPFGQVARDWIVRYLAEARPAILGGQQTEDLFVTARGQGMTRAMFWVLVKKHAFNAGITAPLSPHTLRHAFATHLLKPRRRPARGPDVAWPRGHLDHHHLHPCRPRTVEGAAFAAPPARLNPIRGPFHEPDRRTLLLAGGAAALPAFAQPLYPTKPIRMIVPYPPGASPTPSPAPGRAADRAGGPAGVIENKAGASGTIGIDAVAKAAPDGYTLAFSAISPLTLSPYLGKVPYNPDLDLTPVASVMYSPVLLLATPASAAQNFRDLMGGAKDKPRSVRWATSGNGSLGHLMFEQMVRSRRCRWCTCPTRAAASS